MYYLRITKTKDGSSYIQDLDDGVDLKVIQSDVRDLLNIYSLLRVGVMIEVLKKGKLFYEMSESYLFGNLVETYVYQYRE